MKSGMKFIATVMAGLLVSGITSSASAEIGDGVKRRHERREERREDRRDHRKDRRHDAKARIKKHAPSGQETPAAAQPPTENH